MARPWTAVRSDLAQSCRSYAESDPQLISDLRVELKFSRGADYLTRLVAEAPQLSADQISELQAILSSAHAEVLDATGLPDCGND